ncbi:MAG TPA: PAS domain S-box protein [Deltaproteobacteria bacterium]|nr:PAS domain S-box protein [Deltaproteobacteria bacterium]
MADKPDTILNRVEMLFDDSRLQLHQLIDFLPDPTFSVDRKGRIIVWNRAMEELTGMAAEDMLGKGDYEYALPFYGVRRPILIDLSLKPDPETEKLYPYIKRHGETLYAEIDLNLQEKKDVCLWIKASPIHNDQGKVAGAIESIRDITDLKHTQRSYQESQKRLEQLIDFLPDPTFAVDAKGVVISWNRAMEELTGVTSCDIIGRGDYAYGEALYGIKRPMLVDLVFVPDKEAESRYAYIKRDRALLLAEGYVTIRGSERYLWGKASPIYDHKGIAVGAIESVRDVTEQKNAALEIQKSEKRYRDIFENVSDFLYTHDLSGNFIETNLSFKEKYGYTQEDLGNRKIQDLIPENFRQLYHDYINRVIDQDRDQGLISINTKDGSIRIFEYINSLVRDETGEPLYIRGSARDVTEHRKAEHALRKSEERYRLLAENIRDVIWVLDLDLNYTYISPSVTRMRGYSAQELMNRGLKDVLKPESFAMVQEVFRQEIEKERSGQRHDEFWSRSLEVELRRKDGTFIWSEVIASFMRNEDGRVTHIIGVSRDISQRKQAETALKESEERFRKMAEASPAVFWMVSPDRRKVIYVSPAFERIYGRTCETLYRDPSLWFEVIHPEDRGRLPQVTSEDQGKELDLEYRITRPDGTIRWIHDRSSPIFDDNNELILVSGIMEDITENKKTEEERKLYETRLNRAQKMEAIGTLAGGIAHDFNNILSAIIGYTELSLDDIDRASPLYANLQEVLRAGDRAKDLVRQILTFSRQVDMERRPVRMHLIVKEALKLLRSTIPSTIRIHQEIDTRSGAVFADPTQIHQVIMNLCTNAYHAMADRGGELRVCLAPKYIDAGFCASHPHLAEGPHIRLSVYDTGCGISSAIIERIFDPFFTTKDKGKGTGLGLATVHGIVTDLGGEITVSSTPGSGSSFHVYLPRLETDIREKDLTEESVPAGNNEHILLVDDEEAILQFGKHMLEQLGYSVSTAHASTTALEMFNRNPAQFDLVITDQTMPNMTGEKLASNLLLLRPDIPIILMTGHSETITAQKAAQQGIRCFMEKPFSRFEIGTAIHEALHPHNDMV